MPDSNLEQVSLNVFSTEIDKALSWRIALHSLLYGFHIPTILAAVIAMSLITRSIFLCYAFAARLA